MIYDTAVIGGGPAGMMAAGTAARRGKTVCLIERNGITGKKLSITGKGRCNLTNECDIQTLMRNITRNPKFLYSAFAALDAKKIMTFFEELGVPLKTERGGRVFPVSDRAADVTAALRKYAMYGETTLQHARALELAVENNRITGVASDKGNIMCKSVIIATGGISYPLTGSTGDGYILAKNAGHNIITCIPSLVPLESDDGLCPACQGLTLKNVAVDLRLHGKSVYKDFGELLFTHFGLSGPVILSASAHMRGAEPDEYEIGIDLKPALDHKMLDARVLRDFSQRINRELQNSLDALLPRSLIPEVIKKTGINPETKINSLTKEQRAAIVNTLKNTVIQIKGFRPSDEAIVTSGGVDTCEIDPKTMESRLVKGLFFAGEVIDIDAYTGGFNLQIAFSTGRLAGLSV